MSQLKPFIQFKHIYIKRQAKDIIKKGYPSVENKLIFPRRQNRKKTVKRKTKCIGRINIEN